MKVEFDNIRSIEKIKRLNLINSVVGVKPVVLVGTTGQNQINNLAIFSSLVHMGSNPPLLALNFRPVNNTKRHTYENITQNKFFSINHINEDMIDNAHLTSLKFPKEISEFIKKFPTIIANGRVANRIIIKLSLIFNFFDIIIINYRLFIY